MLFEGVHHDRPEPDPRPAPARPEVPLVRPADRPPHLHAHRGAAGPEPGPECAAVRPYHQPQRHRDEVRGLVRARGCRRRRHPQRRVRAGFGPVLLDHGPGRPEPAGGRGGGDHYPEVHHPRRRQGGGVRGPRDYPPQGSVKTNPWPPAGRSRRPFGSSPMHYLVSTVGGKKVPMSGAQIINSLGSYHQFRVVPVERAGLDLLGRPVTLTLLNEARVPQLTVVGIFSSKEGMLLGHSRAGLLDVAPQSRRFETADPAQFLAAIKKGYPDPPAVECTVPTGPKKPVEQHEQTDLEFLRHTSADALVYD